MKSIKKKDKLKKKQLTPKIAVAIWTNRCNLPDDSSSRFVATRIPFFCSVTYCSKIVEGKKAPSTNRSCIKRCNRRSWCIDIFICVVTISPSSVLGIENDSSNCVCASINLIADSLALIFLKVLSERIWRRHSSSAEIYLKNRKLEGNRGRWERREEERGGKFTCILCSRYSSISPLIRA